MLSEEALQPLSATFDWVANKGMHIVGLNTSVV